MKPRAYVWKPAMGTAAYLAQKYVYSKKPGWAPTGTMKKRRFLKKKKSGYGRRKSSYAGGLIKRPKKFKKNPFVTKGARLTYEYGGVTTDSLCVTVGHATCPRSQMLNALAYALVKLLAYKMQKNIDDFANPIVDAVAGDTIYLVTRNAGDAAGAPVVNNCYTFAAGGQWKNAAVGVYSILLSLSTQIELINISYDRTVDTQSTVRVDLRNAKVHFDCESDMKMQNESIPHAPVAGSDDDPTQSSAIDNVPLYGRSFEGLGSGTSKLNPTSIYSADKSLFSDESTGIISCGNTIDEPESPDVYANVKKLGKVHIAPGAIKTSKLHYRFHGLLNWFISKFSAQVIVGLTKSRVGLGKFRFFSVEKMVETNQGAPYAISVGVEVNNRIQCYVTPSTPPKTNLVIERGVATFT